MNAVLARRAQADQVLGRIGGDLLQRLGQAFKGTDGIRVVGNRLVLP
jgi:hypothetical protein